MEGYQFKSVTVNMDISGLIERCERLIKHNGDYHIATESLNQFRLIIPEDIIENRLIWILVFNSDNEIVGLTIGSTVYENLNFTVVSSNHRNKGIGTTLLQQKIGLIPNYTNWVAGNNIPSLRLNVKIGLSLTGKYKFAESENIILEWRMEK